MSAPTFFVLGNIRASAATTIRCIPSQILNDRRPAGARCKSSANNASSLLGSHILGQVVYRPFGNPSGHGAFADQQTLIGKLAALKRPTNDALAVLQVYLSALRQAAILSRQAGPPDHRADHAMKRGIYGYHLSMGLAGQVSLNAPFVRPRGEHHSTPGTPSMHRYSHAIVAPASAVISATS